MLKESWNARIQRAECLAAGNDATNELLTFYGRLLRVQRETFAKAILQPYARWLAESGTRPGDRHLEIFRVA